MGSFMAIATRDMTGLLSDAPDLAAQISRLARLRRATAEFVSQGQFLDNRGLTVEGGKGYLYQSPRGLAVTIANSQAKPVTSRVTLEIEYFAGFAANKCSQFVEGAKPCSVTPQRRMGALRFEVRLPSHGAAVLTLE